MFECELSEELINLSEWAILDLCANLVSVVLLHVLQVIFIVLVADLAVGVITIRHGLGNLVVVHLLAISVSLKLPLEVLFVLFLTLSYNFVEFFCDKLKLGFAHARAEPMRRIHLELVEINISLRLLL